MTEIPNDFSYENLENNECINLNNNEIINIHNLQFSYENKKEIIKNLDLKIKKGMFLGIAGPSGCGKSSLIKVICKLEQCKGNVIIDNYDINSLSRKDIAQIIALVPQNPFIIAGTIYENICYGLDRKVSQFEVEEAIKKPIYLILLIVYQKN